MKLLREVQIFILICFLHLTNMAVNAQVKFKDPGIPNATSTSLPGAILELQSFSKGLLITRLTTAQRDAINPTNLADGLLIFNTTTGCFNHYSSLQSNWLSICGTAPPAIASVRPDQCSRIVRYGTYKQGVALTAAEYLTIPITVTQSGNYNIVASTTNGYYFSHSGTFPRAGEYTVNVLGTGTPAVGSAVGDTLSITLNGLSANCSFISIVENAEVSYNISCINPLVNGNYYVGVPLSQSNTVDININVGTTGFYNITSDVVNGYSFSGSGNFKSTGNQVIRLTGSGTPSALGTNIFTLRSNSINSSSCTGLSVKISPVSYSLDCNTAKVTGTYKQDVALTDSNTISIPVKITAPGLYSISTNTLNGMTFKGSGRFATEGNQVVTLTGSGTPSGAGTSSFTVNGDGATCSAVDVTVTSLPISYTMDCAGVKVTGSYMQDVKLSDSNTITIPVKVKYPGAYNISTDTLNGMTFRGAGTFVAAGDQVVKLMGSGTPTAPSTSTFTLSGNGSTCPNVKVTVAAQPVTYTMDCVGAKVAGAYMQDKALSDSNYITIPVKIKYPGAYSIVTNTLNGMTFSGSGTFTSAGDQVVKLTGSGTPTASGTTGPFTIKGNNVSCSAVSITVAPRPVSYTMDCSTAIMNGTYVIGEPLTSMHTITFKVNATYGGAYTITTGSVAGISFSGSGLLQVGTNTITLSGSGTPTSGGTQTFVIPNVSVGATASQVCNVKTNIIYRKMNVLGLGEGAYQPGSAGTDISARKILATLGTGATSPVRSKEVVITNGYYSTGATLTNYINNYKIDIIVIGWNYTPDQATIDILDQFIKVKKGVVFCFTENAQFSTNFARTVFGMSNINVTNYDGAGAIYQLVDIDDPVLNGPFGDIRNKYWGQDNSATNYVTGLPADAITFSLGSKNYPNQGVTAYRHANLGFLWAGDGGFLAGNATDTNNGSWPARCNYDGSPAPKPNFSTTYYGGPASVYNSAFYANALAWAFKYVQENKPAN